MKQLLFFICILITALAKAQVTGVVKDRQGNAIPYVNVWVLNEQAGTTADGEGKYSINATGTKTLVFSAVGFKTQHVKAAEASKIVLQDDVTLLDEVVLSNKRGKHKITVGKYNKNKNRYYQGGMNKPDILVKYFAPSQATKEHPFIKNLTFYALNLNEKAVITLRFFNVDKDGSPGKDLTGENIIVEVPKGNKNLKVNLEKYKIMVPENGFFAGFEWMVIDQNKYVSATVYKDAQGKEHLMENFIQYMPQIGTNPSEGSTHWRYTQGKWIANNKMAKNTAAESYQDKYEDLTIKLTLTD